MVAQLTQRQKSMFLVSPLWGHSHCVRYYKQCCIEAVSAPFPKECTFLDFRVLLWNKKKKALFPFVLRALIAPQHASPCFGPAASSMFWPLQWSMQMLGPFRQQYSQPTMISKYSKKCYYKRKLYWLYLKRVKPIVFFWKCFQVEKLLNESQSVGMLRKEVKRHGETA